MPDTTPGVSIEPADRRDTPELARLLSLVDPDSPLPIMSVLQTLAFPPGPLTHGGNLCLVARDADHVVGALLAAPPSWTLTHPLRNALIHAVLAIGGIAVDPARRGHGIASALLHEAERRSRRARRRLLTLEHPPELSGFYTKRGYTAGQERLIVALPEGLQERKIPGWLAAAKPLAPDVSFADMPGAPARIVTGLLPNSHVPIFTRYDQLTRPPRR